MPRPRSLLLTCLLLACAVALGAAVPACQQARYGEHTAAPARPDQPTYRQPNSLPERTVLPLARTDGFLLVEATVGGKHAGQCLLDTGSSVTGLDTGIARRFGLPEVGKITAVGIAGEQRLPLFRVPSMELGGVQLPQQVIAGIHMADVQRGITWPIHGIVGIDALNRAPFTLEARSRRLTLHHPGAFQPDRRADGFQLYQLRGLPAVGAKLRGGGTVLLIIDSGANGWLTLPRELMTQWPAISASRQHGYGASAGVGGTVRNARGWVKELRLLGRTLKDVPTNFEPAPRSFAGHDPPVGRIGTKLIEQMHLSFDVPNERLWVRWLEPEE